jgi:hypothetical protein
MVAGGFAAIFYGEPRLTVDIDIVVDIKNINIKPLLEAFPFPDYYWTLDKSNCLDLISVELEP